MNNPISRASYFVLREPLVHFLVAGGGLFVIFQIFGSPLAVQKETITIAAEDVERLAESYASLWRRPPTDDELATLIEEQIRDEVMYREALSLGLDENDPIIRERLREKLSFVLDESLPEVDPTDAELQAFMEANTERFPFGPRVSFRQVSFSRDKRGDTMQQDATSVLQQLREEGNSADTSGLGDSLLLPKEFQRAPHYEVKRLFGDVFAAALEKAAPGVWSGPFESWYGLHLVLVGERETASLPALDEVRDMVAQAWKIDQQRAAIEVKYLEMRQGFHIVVERAAVAEPEAP